MGQSIEGINRFNSEGKTKEQELFNQYKQITDRELKELQTKLSLSENLNNKFKRVVADYEELSVIQNARIK